jgi:hypothetical protein
MKILMYKSVPLERPACDSDTRAKVLCIIYHLEKKRSFMRYTCGLTVR